MWKRLLKWGCPFWQKPQKSIEEWNQGKTLPAVPGSLWVRGTMVTPRAQHFCHGCCFYINFGRLDCVVQFPYFSNHKFCLSAHTKTWWNNHSECRAWKNVSPWRLAHRMGNYCTSWNWLLETTGTWLALLLWNCPYLLGIFTVKVSSIFSPKPEPVLQFGILYLW